MTEESYSVETVVTVHNDTVGYSISIGPDTDGLELCRIVYSEGQDKKNDVELIISWGMAANLAGAINKAMELR